jgi:hypothetical protein
MASKVDPYHSVLAMIKYLKFDIRDLIPSYCKKQRFDTIGLYEHMMNNSTTLYTTGEKPIKVNFLKDIATQEKVLRDNFTDRICVREHNVHLGAAALIDRRQRLKDGDESCAETDVYVLTPAVIQRCHQQKWIEAEIRKALVVYEDDYVGPTFPQDAFELYTDGAEMNNSAANRKRLRKQYFKAFPGAMRPPS